MNEGLRSPDNAGARAPSYRGDEVQAQGLGSIPWAITLHSAAGQRWLKHEPPEIEELKRTFSVIGTMCALLEQPIETHAVDPAEGALPHPSNG